MPMHPDDDPSADILALLRAIDHPVPAVTAESIARRAHAPDRRLPAWRWAAAVLLSLGLAGAAFALPGSPLRRWAVALVGSALERPPAAPNAVALPEEQSPDGGRAGIAVLPGRALIIFVNRPPPGAVALVSLVSGTEVVVRATAGAATFTTGPDRLMVEGRDKGRGRGLVMPDTIAIDIPRDAPRVEIRTEGARLLLKVGDHLSPPLGSQAGPWLLRLGTAESP
jgi:hypothetical protein